MQTLYWHDYETSGLDPRSDRPVQFAGLRTDLDLNPVDAPLTLFCRPAGDALPHPDAALITAITPQRARAEGLREAEFAARIHAEMMRPATCSVGYNSLRFDDEFTRCLLYRNLFDPYEREWRNGNSRWDLIDVMRLARALRPEGIAWPFDANGAATMRLEALAAANDIEHNAHDALGDVRAAIALARLLKKRQPRLYAYAFDHRDKRSAARMLNLADPTPVVHASGMFPATRGHLGLILPLARHPTNANGVIVADLHYDPAPLLELEAEALRERLYTALDALPEGTPRIALKTVHLNRCPVLVPLNTLDAATAERLGIDRTESLRRAATLHAARATEAFVAKLRAVHAPRQRPQQGVSQDPEQMLYDGFIGDADRAALARLRALPPEALSDTAERLDDPRLPELLFRWRARNWPETLNGEERERWATYRRRRILDADGGASLRLDGYRARIAALRADPCTTVAQRAILDALAAYGDEIAAEVGVEETADGDQ